MRAAKIPRQRSRFVDGLLPPPYAAREHALGLGLTRRDDVHPIHNHETLPAGLQSCTLVRWTKARSQIHLTRARQRGEHEGRCRKRRPSAFSASNSNDSDCRRNRQRQFALCPIHTMPDVNPAWARHTALTGFGWAGPGNRFADTLQTRGFSALTRKSRKWLIMLAPRAGFEPATIRLTVECSTAELPRNRRNKCSRAGSV